MRFLWVTADSSENVCSLNELWELGTQVSEKAEELNAFFSLVFTSKTGRQESYVPEIGGKTGAKKCTVYHIGYPVNLSSNSSVSKESEKKHTFPYGNLAIKCWGKPYLSNSYSTSSGTRKHYVKLYSFSCAKL